MNVDDSLYIISSINILLGSTSRLSLQSKEKSSLSNWFKPSGFSTRHMRHIRAHRGKPRHVYAYIRSVCIYIQFLRACTCWQLDVKLWIHYYSQFCTYLVYKYISINHDGITRYPIELFCLWTKWINYPTDHCYDWIGLPANPNWLALIWSAGCYSIEFSRKSVPTGKMANGLLLGLPTGNATACA